MAAFDSSPFAACRLSLCLTLSQYLNYQVMVTPTLRHDPFSAYALPWFSCASFLAGIFLV